MVREVGNTSYSMLTCTNYGECVRLWHAVEIGTTNEVEDQLAMEAILQPVPPEYVQTLGSKETAKQVWDSLKTMCVGSDYGTAASAGVQSQLHSTMMRQLRTLRCGCSCW
jgi:xanthine/CO dehydrogenase XdhC/CoxF family maturation factor